MSLIDIKGVKEQARKELAEEAFAKAKSQLLNQMRVVAQAEKILAAERLKLEDLEARIAEGT